MIKLKPKEKLLIIFLIIFVSLVLPIKEMGLMSKKAKKGVPSVKYQKAKNIFENYNNYIKETMVFETSNYEEAIKKINEIKNSTDVFVRYSDIDLGNNASFLIIEYPSSQEEEIKQKLSKIKGLEAENTINRSDIQSFDFDSHIKSAKETLNTISNRLSTKQNLTAREIEKFEKEKNRLLVKIDSLVTKNNIVEKEKAFNLLFTTIKKASDSEIGKFNLVKSYILKVVRNLIGAILLLIIIFYLYVIINKIMLLIGIKTERVVSNRSDGYGYQTYSKKIKRKYKDQKSSSD